ncbi:MAG: hypothetical protein JRH09_10765 [Deltaproteobacteria bacterium]|nr:hypothetical protein [Deltaproteobacteria bacterium]
MKLFIEPTDVWLFRDNKPFDAGSDHRTVSQFPPSPRVIAGVLRSHHLVIKGVDLRCPSSAEIIKLVGTSDDPPAGFRLRGPVLARWENEKLIRYYPLPADAFLGEVEKGLEVYQAQIPTSRPYGLKANLPNGLLLLRHHYYGQHKGKMAQTGVWVAESDLLNYLLFGSLPAERVKESDELFTIENRIGIGLNDATRSAQATLLYEVGFVRLRELVGLMVEVSGLDGSEDWPRRGMISIGGENRAGQFHRVDDGQVPEWPENQSKEWPHFKIYFLTPACFDRGWQPSDWGKWFTKTLRLVGAAIHRPMLLGGHDLAQHTPKAVRRYVPAGAVYFFEGEPSLKPNITAISDYGAKLGFGQFMLGRW